MGRTTSDPWKKKTAKGMRILNNMTKTSIKVGSAIYNESQKNKKVTNPTNYNSETENVPITGSGCAIMLIAFIAVIVILISTEYSLGGLITSIIIMVISSAIATVVSKDTTIIKHNNISTTNNTQNSFIVNNILVNRLSNTLINNGSYEDIIIEISQFNNSEKEKIIYLAFEKAIKELQERGYVDDTINDSIDNFIKCFNLSKYELEQSPKFKDLVKLFVINDLLSGILSQRMDIKGNIPINLQKEEEIIWFFPEVENLELKEKVVYQGVSQGLNIKIADGLYYKAGAFKGTPITTKEVKSIAFGQLYLTNKNIYFYSLEESIKIPYSKIIAYTPFEDAIGVQKEGKSSKSIYFKNIDGWFVFNVVKNIQNIK